MNKVKRKNKSRYIITGAAAIGDHLDEAPNTVLRKIAKGVYPAFRGGSATSPWKMFVKDIVRIRAAQSRQHMQPAE